MTLIRPTLSLERASSYFSGLCLMSCAMERSSKTPVGYAPARYENSV